jgi:hypothetical protein
MQGSILYISISVENFPSKSSKFGQISVHKQV